MFRNQPPGFRWLVGGFAALAGLAFVIRFFTDDDRPALLFGIVCLVAAGYWLIFDRETAAPAEDPGLADQRLTDSGFADPTEQARGDE